MTRRLTPPLAQWTNAAKLSVAMFGSIGLHAACSGAPRAPDAVHLSLTPAATSAAQTTSAVLSGTAGPAGAPGPTGATGPTGGPGLAAATLGGGLEFTGTPPAVSVGLRSDCNNNQVLRWHDPSSQWECGFASDGQVLSAGTGIQLSSNVFSVQSTQSLSHLTLASGNATALAAANGSANATFTVTNTGSGSAAVLEGVSSTNASLRVLGSGTAPAIRAEGNSTVSQAQLTLRETENDAARLAFLSTQNPTQRWLVSGEIGATQPESQLRLSFVTGGVETQVLTLTGDGRVIVNSGKLQLGANAFNSGINGYQTIGSVMTGGGVSCTIICTRHGLTCAAAMELAPEVADRGCAFSAYSANDKVICSCSH